MSVVNHFCAGYLGDNQYWEPGMVQLGRQLVVIFIPTAFFRLWHEKHTHCRFITVPRTSLGQWKLICRDAVWWDPYRWSICKCPYLEPRRFLHVCNWFQVSIRSMSIPRCSCFLAYTGHHLYSGITHVAAARLRSRLLLANLAY
jgi:hypothetical protein